MVTRHMQARYMRMRSTTSWWRHMGKTQNRQNKGGSYHQRFKANQCDRIDNLKARTGKEMTISIPHGPFCLYAAVSWLQNIFTTSYSFLRIHTDTHFRDLSIRRRDCKNITHTLEQQLLFCFSCTRDMTTHLPTSISEPVSESESVTSSSSSPPLALRFRLTSRG